MYICILLIGDTVCLGERLQGKFSATSLQSPVDGTLNHISQVYFDDQCSQLYPCGHSFVFACTCKAASV